MDKRPRGRPRKDPTQVVAGRVPLVLAEALTHYIQSTRPEPSTGAVLRDALELYLNQKGFWPPQDSDKP